MPEAMAALEEVAKQTLPPEFSYDWADLSYQERKASGTTTRVFGLSLVFVFLILAALYESWSLPFSVLLTIPVAIFGAFLGLAHHPGGKHRHQRGGKDIGRNHREAHCQ